MADRPERRLRAEIGEFLDRCGRLGLGDLPGAEAIDSARRVRELRNDPGQHRGSSEVERRALRAVDRLGLHDTGEEDLDDTPGTVAAEEVLASAIPGEWPFALVSWAAGTTLLDGVETPFSLAHRVVHVAVFDPPDPYGLLGPLTDLRDRWWAAEEDEQPELAAGIRDVFARSVAAAPYPR